MLARFQHRFGLNVTGKINQETLDLMAQPRCGNVDSSNRVDKVPVKNIKKYLRGRQKRYYARTKWRYNNLTYTFANFGDDEDLTPEEIRSQIRLAFDKWSEVVPLTFTEVDKSPFDIQIGFYKRRHGFRGHKAFDGRSGVLAHAFLPFGGRNQPRTEGDTHFDDDELWTYNTSRGKKTSRGPWFESREGQCFFFNFT